jgi:hypothetical protein
MRTRTRYWLLTAAAFVLLVIFVFAGLAPLPERRDAVTPHAEPAPAAPAPQAQAPVGPDPSPPAQPGAGATPPPPGGVHPGSTAGTSSGDAPVGGTR